MARHRLLRYCAYVRPFVLLAVLSATCRLHAQSTVADLRARLIKQPLYLRGQWREDKLHFDASGQLLGRSDLTTFTIAGIDVRSVDLKGDRLVLKGKRAGIEFRKDLPQRVIIDAEPMQIDIAAPTGGDYTQALDRILTNNLLDMVQTPPSYWSSFVQHHLLPHPTPQAPGADGIAVPSSSTASSSTLAGSYKPGGVLTAPRILQQTEPQFSAQARALKYAANVLVSLVVDANGNPTQLFIVRPAGLELDERALAAVARYKFAPSTLNGEPAPVQVNIDVNFQIF